MTSHSTSVKGKGPVTHPPPQPSSSSTASKKKLSFAPSTTVRGPPATKSTNNSTTTTTTTTNTSTFGTTSSSHSAFRQTALSTPKKPSLKYKNQPQQRLLSSYSCVQVLRILTYHVANDNGDRGTELEKLGQHLNVIIPRIGFHLRNLTLFPGLDESGFGSGSLAGEKSGRERKKERREKDVPFKFKWFGSECEVEFESDDEYKVAVATCRGLGLDGDGDSSSLFWAWRNVGENEGCHGKRKCKGMLVGRAGKEKGTREEDADLKGLFADFVRQEHVAALKVVEYCLAMAMGTTSLFRSVPLVSRVVGEFDKVMGDASAALRELLEAYKFFEDISVKTRSEGELANVARGFRDEVRDGLLAVMFMAVHRDLEPLSSDVSLVTSLVETMFAGNMGGGSVSIGYRQICILSTLLLHRRLFVFGQTVSRGDLPAFLQPEGLLALYYTFHVAWQRSEPRDADAESEYVGLLLHYHGADTSASYAYDRASDAKVLGLLLWSGLIHYLIHNIYDEAELADKLLKRSADMIEPVRFQALVFSAVYHSRCMTILAKHAALELPMLGVIRDYYASSLMRLFQSVFYGINVAALPDFEALVGVFATIRDKFSSVERCESLVDTCAELMHDVASLSSTRFPLRPRPLLRVLLSITTPRNAGFVLRYIDNLQTYLMNCSSSVIKRMTFDSDGRKAMLQAPISPLSGVVYDMPQKWLPLASDIPAGVEGRVISSRTDQGDQILQWQLTYSGFDLLYILLELLLESVKHSARSPVRDVCDLEGLAYEGCLLYERDRELHDGNGATANAECSLSLVLADFVRLVQKLVESGTLNTGSLMESMDHVFQRPDQPAMSLIPTGDGFRAPSKERWMEMVIELMIGYSVNPSFTGMQLIAACMDFVTFANENEPTATWAILVKYLGGGTADFVNVRQWTLNLRSILQLFEVPTGTFPVTTALVQLVQSLLDTLVEYERLDETQVVEELVHYVLSEVWPGHTSWAFALAEERTNMSTAALGIVNTILHHDAWMFDVESGNDTDGARVLRRTLEQFLVPHSSYYHIHPLPTLLQTFSEPCTSTHILVSTLKAVIAILRKCEIMENSSIVVVKNIFENRPKTLGPLLEILGRDHFTTDIKRLILRLLGLVANALAGNPPGDISFRTFLGRDAEDLVKALVDVLHGGNCVTRREVWRLCSIFSSVQPWIIEDIAEAAEEREKPVATSSNSTVVAQPRFLALAIKDLQDRDDSVTFSCLAFLRTLWHSPDRRGLVDQWRKDTRFWRTLADVLERDIPVLKIPDYSGKVGSLPSLEALTSVARGYASRSSVFRILAYEVHHRASSKLPNNKTFQDGLLDSKVFETHAAKDILVTPFNSGKWIAMTLFDEERMAKWLVGFPNAGRQLLRDIRSLLKHDFHTINRHRRWTGPADHLGGLEYEFGEGFTYSIESMGLQSISRTPGTLVWAISASSLYDSNINAGTEMLAGWSVLTKTLMGWVKEGSTEVSQRFTRVMDMLHLASDPTDFRSYEQWCSHFEPSYLRAYMELVDHSSSKLVRVPLQSADEIRQCIDVTLKNVPWEFDSMISAQQGLPREILIHHLNTLHVLFHSFSLSRQRGLPKRNGNLQSGQQAGSSTSVANSTSNQCFKVFGGLLRTISIAISRFGKGTRSRGIKQELNALFLLLGDLVDKGVAGPRMRDVLLALEEHQTPNQILQLFQALLPVRDWPLTTCIVKVLLKVTNERDAAQVFMRGGMLAGLSQLPLGNAGDVIEDYYDVEKEKIQFPFFIWVTVLRLACQLGASVAPGDEKEEVLLHGFVAAYESRMLQTLVKTNETWSKSRLTIAQLDELVAITEVFAEHARVTASNFRNENVHTIKQVQRPAYQLITLELFLTLQNMLVMQLPLRRVSYPVTKKERDMSTTVAKTDILDPARLYRKDARKDTDLDGLRQKFYSISSSVTTMLERDSYDLSTIVSRGNSNELLKHQAKSSGIIGGGNGGGGGGPKVGRGQASMAHQIHANVAGNQDRTEFFCEMEQKLFVVVHNLLKIIRFVTLADRVLADVPSRMKSSYHNLGPPTHSTRHHGAGVSGAGAVGNGSVFGESYNAPLGSSSSPFAIIQPTWQSASVTHTSLGILNNFLWFILIRFAETSVAKGALETTIVVIVSQMLYRSRDELDTRNDNLRELETGIDTWQALVVKDPVSKELVKKCEAALSYLKTKEQVNGRQ